MIPKAIESMTAEHLEALVENEVAERRTLEFKVELPGGIDKQKKEFLADVSSFANAAGGDLVYGVEAEDGVARRVVGLPGFNADKDILRLESLIRDGVSPRIPAVRLQQVIRPLNSPVLVIRVPRSWQSPHMVTFKGTSRFYSRTSKGKHQLDVGEIRSAFLSAEGIRTRTGRFLDERLSRIVAAETPVPLPGGRLILHIVPLMSFGTEWDSPLLTPSLIAAAKGFFAPILGRTEEAWPNLEGFFTRTCEAIARRGTFWGYCQVFTNGAIEAVDTQILNGGDGWRDGSDVGFFGIQLAKKLIKAVTGYVSGLETMNLLAPYVVRLVVTGVRGWKILSAEPSEENSPNRFDRQDLILPPTVASDSETVPARLLRPILDALWNAAGYLRCDLYDEHGDWAGS